MTSSLHRAGRRAGSISLNVCLFLAAAAGSVTGQTASGPNGQPKFVDLSLLVAAGYPCTWPTFPPFQMNEYERIGPLSAYHSEILVIDGNTGTQLDVPPHSVTPAESAFSNSGPFGRTYTDVVPAWQFAGEACVIDCRDLRESAPAGQSSLITKERVVAWEKEHRKLGPGDVVLFYSGYSDAYYQAASARAPVCGRATCQAITRMARPRPGVHGVPRRARA